MFVETAPGMMKMTATRRVDAYMILRPTISLSGANIMGPVGVSQA